MAKVGLGTSIPKKKGISTKGSPAQQSLLGMIPKQVPPESLEYFILGAALMSLLIDAEVKEHFKGTIYKTVIYLEIHKSIIKCNKSFDESLGITKANPTKEKDNA